MADKIKNEKQTRNALLKYARKIGAEEDLKHLFDKWDRILALSPPSEREDISKMAILEVQSLLDIHAEEGLTINNDVVIPKTI